MGLGTKDQAVNFWLCLMLLCAILWVHGSMNKDPDPGDHLLSVDVEIDPDDEIQFEEHDHIGTKHDARYMNDCKGCGQLPHMCECLHDIDFIE
jgi:hypothetical protein